MKKIKEYITNQLKEDKLNQQMKCHQELMDFYAEYLANNDANFRRKLIDNLIANRICDCYDKVLKKTLKK